jgi:long-chain acyl-CoA synthetase
MIIDRKTLCRAEDEEHVLNLVEFLKVQAKKYRDKTLLLGEGGSFSYRSFDEITDRIAFGLERLEILPDDHVAVLLPNSVQTLVIYYAIIKARGVVIPINTIYTAREVKFILNNSEAKILILHENFFPLIKEIENGVPLVKRFVVQKNHEPMDKAIERQIGSPLFSYKEKDIDADKPAIIFYTSGTTGHPKGVILTHGNFCFGGPNIAQNYGLRETDIAIAVLPLVHVFCVASPFLGSLSSGGSVVVLERFKTELVFESIAQYEATWFPGVPTMFAYLLNGFVENRYDLSSLRMGLSGGASLPVDVLNEWEHRFGATVIEVYGLTESTGLVTANPVYGKRKPGSIGITVSGVTAKVVDKEGNELRPREVGELVFKGPNATPGYFNLPTESREKIREGWVYTGDHAWRDEEGYFYIVGREKELIVSGGYNIYPREIEEVLQGYPGISETAVIGVSDPIQGEVPKAFVSLKKGCKITENELLEYCKKNLAPYKIPRITFMDELPKNITGKIMKKDLPKE